MQLVSQLLEPEVRPERLQLLPPLLLATQCVLLLPLHAPHPTPHFVALLVELPLAPRHALLVDS